MYKLILTPNALHSRHLSANIVSGISNCILLKSRWSSTSSNHLNPSSVSKASSSLGPKTHTPQKDPYSPSSFARIQDSLKKYIRWYPDDDVTGSNIENFFSLTRNTERRQDLLVGIVYENEFIQNSSKLLQVILADPLSSGSQSWYQKLEDRSRTQNNLVCHPECEESRLQFPESFTRSIQQYKVPSPLLWGETRSKFNNILLPLSTVANDVMFLEINKPEEVAKLIDVCHFYIYVAADLSNSKGTLPKQIQKKILLTVVDNAEFTPKSTELTPVTFRLEVAQHVVKINSSKLDLGIKYFYDFDVEGASKYFDSLQESNILEMTKYLLWFLRTENLRDWLLSIIKTEISTNKISEARIEAVYNDLRLSSLVQCSNAMHAELQNDFIPQTNAFFKQKLGWWKLYLKNDNVEYALKDYFNSHFMPKSIDSYNYVKGQLVARLQEQKFAHYTESDKMQLDNPLQVFKANLINNKVPTEVQLAVYAALVSALVYYQLPLSIISLLGYLFFGIQAQTAGAIAALGWVLGFNKVSKDWLAFTSTWLSQLYEEVRLVLSRDCINKGLLKELNLRYEAAQDLSRIKQQVVDELEASEIAAEVEGKKIEGVDEMHGTNN